MLSRVVDLSPTPTRAWRTEGNLLLTRSPSGNKRCPAASFLWGGGASFRWTPSPMIHCFCLPGLHLRLGGVLFAQKRLRHAGAVGNNNPENNRHSTTAAHQSGRGDKRRRHCRHPPPHASPRAAVNVPRVPSLASAQSSCQEGLLSFIQRRRDERSGPSWRAPGWAQPPSRGRGEHSERVGFHRSDAGPAPAFVIPASGGKP